MNQKIVRVDEVTLPEGKSFGWNVVLRNRKVVAFENPRFGRFEHVAFLNADTGEFLYDGIRKFDGPVGENNHSIPSAIFVVTETREDGIYLYCQEEFRPVIYDHVNGLQGVKCLGFAGGFSRRGEKPNETALRELLEEQGIKVDNTSVKMIGYASDNRASTETCIEVYLGRFSRMSEPKPNNDEMILRNVIVRIDQFPCGLDGIINSAYAMVVAHLGLIKPK